MLVKYKYRTTRRGTEPKGKHQRFQADTDDIKRLFKYEKDIIMWMVVDMPDGSHWYYNRGHWTQFNCYRSFFQ